jgi:hypothetical protein
MHHEEYLIVNEFDLVNGIRLIKFRTISEERVN